MAGTLKPWAYAAWSLLALAGCDNGPLHGSVSELFALTVASEELLRNPEAFQVNYFANRNRGEDLVIQLSVSLAGVNFIPGARVRLEGEYLPGHPRTTVVHLAVGEPTRTLPLVKLGTLNLSQGGAPKQLTSGDFSLSFVDDGSYGSGRTVLGSFAGIALDGGF